MWEKKGTAGEIRPPWELLQHILVRTRRHFRLRQALFIDGEDVEGIVRRRVVPRRVYADSLSGSSDMVWAALISFLRGAFGGSFAFRRGYIASLCVCLVLVSVVFSCVVDPAYRPSLKYWLALRETLCFSY